MLKEFTTSVQKEKLFKKTDRILLAVSGGIDSVVMCELFHKAGFEFAIAHCNFQLRGNESEEDENFVEGLSEKYGVKFHTGSFNTSAFAKKNKLSIQSAARKLRYDWFEEIRRQYDYDAIATAHHGDDSIETFFINLVRGTGISGLHGILPKQGKIVRPLLGFSKQELIEFGKKAKLKYREDSSNASDKYLRNKIRLKLIPLLEEMNPSIRRTLTEEISRLQDAEKIYRERVEKKGTELLEKKQNFSRISLKKMRRSENAQTYLFELLRPFGFNASTSKEIFGAIDATPGKQFVSKSHRLIKDREYFIIEAREGELDSGCMVDRQQRSVKLEGLELKFGTISASGNINRKNTVANLDLEKLEFPLELRRWRKGDSFYPFGMKGKKKLSDFFIDSRVSLAEKEKTWLLCSGGRIAWVVGMRIDDRFRVDAKTKKIFVAEQV